RVPGRRARVRLRLHHLPRHAAAAGVRPREDRALQARARGLRSLHELLRAGDHRPPRARGDQGARRVPGRAPGLRGRLPAAPPLLRRKRLVDGCTHHVPAGRALRRDREEHVAARADARGVLDRPDAARAHGGRPAGARHLLLPQQPRRPAGARRDAVRRVRPRPGQARPAAVRGAGIPADRSGGIPGDRDRPAPPPPPPARGHQPPPPAPAPLGVPSEPAPAPRTGARSHYHLGNSSRRTLLQMLGRREPTVVTIHDVVPRDRRLLAAQRALVAPLLRRRGTALVVHSETAAGMLRALTGVRPERVRGIPIAAPRMGEVSRRHARAALGWPEDELIALLPGVLKSVKLVGEAASAASAAGWRLALAGRVLDAELVRRARAGGALVCPNPDRATYERAIKAADAVLVLRASSVGEANMPLLEAPR